MKKHFIAALLVLLAPCISVGEPYTPEPGSAENNRKKKAKTKIDPSLPMVLILGDSISIGYTSHVAKALRGKANVIHNPGNSQGTTHTLKNLDKWLKMQKWDVIHFNLGLHDLKRVKKAGTSENSNNPEDPYQADIPTYTANLDKIATRLTKTKAKLIFATTTPFPKGVKPYRDPEDVAKYNAAAKKIMQKHSIPINDLHALVTPEISKLQKPNNVHFKRTGSKKMATQVAEIISKQLQDTSKP